jgi:hypothetical protein
VESVEDSLRGGPVVSVVRESFVDVPSASVPPGSVKELVFSLRR